jgi:hypothetical protein
MIGLIIRFENTYQMNQWIESRKQVYDDPDLQARPADSSDPKELYVLNRGKDGYNQ